MRKTLTAALFVSALIMPAVAQENETPAPSPNQIVDAAPAEDWVSIPADDLLVMMLAPDVDGNPREVIIQLMPPPFSQGWVHNIKLLARSGWYDGTSVNRVQDNYVVQWGDPNHDNPEADAEQKTLPGGLKVMGEDEYSASHDAANEAGFYAQATKFWNTFYQIYRERSGNLSSGKRGPNFGKDHYSKSAQFGFGWPLALQDTSVNPVHCYGMVGVGRNYSPDTGSGAELYTVIGHAPRHLDRNIALVGRIIEGMEHLSSLPRGKGQLGFYEDPAKRTPILSIRVASDIPEFPQPSFEYLSTESESFAKYAEARANRRDPFFIVPAGGADICNIPVPVRRVVTD